MQVNIISKLRVRAVNIHCKGQILQIPKQLIFFTGERTFFTLSKARESKVKHKNLLTPRKISDRDAQINGKVTTTSLIHHHHWIQHHLFDNIVQFGYCSLCASASKLANVKKVLSPVKKIICFGICSKKITLIAIEEVFQTLDNRW